MIVVRLKEGSEEMQAVFSEVEERLAGIDVEKEKSGLRPHITLGRKTDTEAVPNGDPMPIEEEGVRG